MSQKSTWKVFVGWNQKRGIDWRQMSVILQDHYGSEPVLIQQKIIELTNFKLVSKGLFSHFNYSLHHRKIKFMSFVFFFMYLLCTFYMLHKSKFINLYLSKLSVKMSYYLYNRGCATSISKKLIRFNSHLNPTFIIK